MPLKQRILLSNIAYWLIILLCLPSLACVVYLTNETDPVIREIYTHNKLLHQPPMVSDNGKLEFDEKNIIRGGAKIYIYREYEMIGDFNNGNHYTWIHNMDNGMVYKYPTTQIIGFKGVIKVPFFYQLPSSLPIGRYMVVTRIFGYTNIMNKYVQDLSPVYFEVK